MAQNPFFYGYPVGSAHFLDRREPLRRVVGRLLSGGQSTAIVGEPRIGKTSLLHCLAAPETRGTLYGPAGETMLFSYIDSHMLGERFTPAQFWEQVLLPLKAQTVDREPDSAIAKQYALCQANNFGTFTLETLIRLLREAGWRIVLLLDEFDMLLHHPVLNSAEFFGGMRSLASTSRGALALVAASRLSLSALNEHTHQTIKFTGSPYFNIFAEITLGAFPERHVATLLARAGHRFTTEDRRAIRAVAGAHPYLLQAAAAAMWDAWEEGIDEVSVRHHHMALRLHREHRLHFDDTWQAWSPAMRKSFTTVALAHANDLLPERSFLLDPFLKALRDYERELDELETSGLLARDDDVEGGWRVAQEVMLWWLADELARVVRADTPFDEWLKAQELEYMLTPDEREQLRAVVNKASEVLQRGASTLIEAFVQGQVGRL